MTRTLNILGLLCLLLLGAIGGAGAQSLNPNMIPGLVAQYLASGGYTTTTNGAGIPTATVSTTVYSPATNLTMFQATVAAQPTYLAAGPGGKGAFSFAGAQYLQGPGDQTAQSPFNFLATGSYSFFFVYTPGASTPNSALFTKSGDPNNNEIYNFISYQGALPSFSQNGGLSGNVPAATTTVVVYTVVLTAPGVGIQTLYINGVKASTKTGALPTLVDTLNPATIGMSTPAYYPLTSVGNFAYTGTISTLGAFNHALSLYEVAAITNSLAAAYGGSVTALSSAALTAPNITRALFTVTTKGSNCQQVPIWGQTAQSLTIPVYSAGGSYLGGTAPYTFEWHRNTASGFTPGSGDIVGTNSATLADTGLLAGTNYYYVCKITDSSATPGIVTTPQYTFTTARPTEGIIGIIGDSISVLDPGLGLAADNGNPSDQFALQMNRATGQKYYVVNYAWPGTTTNDWQPSNTTGSFANALTNAEAAFAATNVKYVLLMLGANDCRSGYEDGPVSAATYATRLSAIVASLTSQGYIVILNQPSWVNWDQSTPLIPQYGSAMLPLVNGNSVRQGDTQAYSYFGGIGNGYISATVHPINAGMPAFGGLWATGFYYSVVAPAVLAQGGPVKRSR